MGRKDLYQIAFTGLAHGMHTFDFQVGDTFFEDEQDSLISGGLVDVAVTLFREERMMDFHLRLSGKVTVPCDRCNEPVEIPVSGEERLIVKLGDSYHEESDEVQVIPETSNQFDLAPFLYEYIHLLLPARHVHGEEGAPGTCSPEVLKKLEELRGSHGHDPRWDVLNRLKNT